MDEAITPQTGWPDSVADPVVDPIAAPMRRARRRPRWPGRLALGFGLLTPFAVAAGILTATDAAYLPATVLAYAALGTSALAVLTGLVAIIGRWGRGPGIAGLVLGVLANPLAQLYVLEALGSL